MTIELLNCRAAPVPVGTPCFAAFFVKLTSNGELYFGWIVGDARVAKEPGMGLVVLFLRHGKEAER